jgi:hypothetical protein
MLKTELRSVTLDGSPNLGIGSVIAGAIDLSAGGFSGKKGAEG